MPSMPSAESPAPAGSYQHPSVILVVDDILAQRYTLTRTLEQAGFRVLQAASGSEALRVAQSQADAVLLDINLPDVNGYEVARRLRANPETAVLPIIHVSSADITDAHRALSVASGADEHVAHPFEPTALVARLRALIGRSR